MSNEHQHEVVTSHGIGDASASDETVRAQQQWLKDGTIPVSYLDYVIGSHAVCLLRPSDIREKK